jgi:hypothetical protein
MGALLEGDALHVYFVAYSFQVLRIDAEFVLAEVVDIQIVRDRAIYADVGITVSRGRPALSGGIDILAKAVTVLRIFWICANPPIPVPAARRFIDQNVPTKPLR